MTLSNPNENTRNKDTEQNVDINQDSNNRLNNEILDVDEEVNQLVNNSNNDNNKDVEFNIDIENLEKFDEIEAIDTIINNIEINDSQTDFPTIEVIEKVQQNRKKRQFSTNEDEEMSRLEFQQWTSGFLNDDLEENVNVNVDVNIDDVEVEYVFPQTTAAHFTEIIDDSNSNHINNLNNMNKRKKLIKKLITNDAITVNISNDTNNKNNNNNNDYDSNKIIGIRAKGKEKDRDEENVDPELANLDTIVNEEILHASLHYLDNKKDDDDNNKLIDNKENEEESLAVEEVNRVVHQAVAAVVKEETRKEENDTDVIAAAVVAAEKAVRKRLQYDGLTNKKFEIFVHEDLNNESNDINEPLVTEHGFKNNKVRTKTVSKVKNDSKKKVRDKVKDNKQTKYKNNEGITSFEKLEDNGDDKENQNKMKSTDKSNVDTNTTNENSIIAKEELNAAIEKAHAVVAGKTSGRSFTTAETEAIDVFIKEYEKIHGMSHEMFLQRIWGNQRVKDRFWEILQDVLPNRTRSSLYKHVRRTYHIFEKRGVWTPEEDAQLAELAVTFNARWKVIGEQLQRMPEDCRDRWRNYVKCGNVRNVNKWTSEEEEHLGRIIADILEEGRGKETKGVREAQVAPTINWNTVSERMGGTRSRIQCRYKWKKLMRTASVAKLRTMPRSMQEWLLGKIVTLAQDDPNLEANLDWDALAMSVPNGTDISGKEVLWNGVDLNVCFQRLRAQIDGWRGMKMGEVAQVVLQGFNVGECADRLEKEN
jgi:Myb-like DNA-binding protein REB1